MKWRVEKENIYLQSEGRKAIRARIFLIGELAAGSVILDTEEQFEDLKTRLEG